MAIFYQVAITFFALAQRLFRQLALGDVFNSALVIEQLTARVAHCAHVIRHPDFGSVFPITLKLKTLHAVVLVQQPLEFVSPRRLDVPLFADIGAAGNQFRR